MQTKEARQCDRDWAREALFLCVLAAVVMAYGWGYRGITGATRGGMAAGGMLGMALALGARRADWQRRAAICGLFGAVGWGWGGSFSYMEQTFYTVTDSFPDVLFGYACLFFLGALWAGIGGAILGLAFTRPASALERFLGPFVAMALAFFVFDLCLLLNEEWRLAVGRFTALHFPNAEVEGPLLVLVVNSLYALARKKERAESLLFAACAVAWWLGYLLLYKVGGLSLGPPYRLETWTGILGVQIVLVAYLVWQRNRAALLLCLYGMLGGGLAFAVAVFVRHPVRVAWAPLAAWSQLPQWKIAEETFGLLMGLSIALGVLRLMKGGLAAPLEDVSTRRLNLFSAFFLLVVVLWLNLAAVPSALITRWEVLPKGSLWGLPAGGWFLLGGLLFAGLVVYCLRRYNEGAMELVPEKPYGKGLLLFLLFTWITVVGGLIQMLPGAAGEAFPLVDASFVLLSAMGTAMLLSRRGETAAPVRVAGVPAEDSRWLPSWRYGLGWVLVLPVLLGITGMSLAMQDGPVGGARLRFGPDAYWREALRVVGVWDVTGFAPGAGEAVVADAPAPPFTRIAFARNRTVSLTLPNGDEVSGQHAWQHKDSVIWLEWYGQESKHADRASIPMTLKDGLLYIPWPPSGERAGVWVLRKAGE